MDTATTVTLNARSVWFTPQKEEAYFKATFTLPRVGEVSPTYSADRYTYHDGKWSEWRIYRRDEIAGVGPKTADKVREIVEPVIEAWLNSEAYAEARQKAVAQFVIRELSTSRYGINHAKSAFEKYRAELSFFDQTRIAQAIDHLEAAAALLEGEEA